jgi:hypothetical protein
MKFKLSALVVVFLMASGVAQAQTQPTLERDGQPQGETYLVFELYGGRWYDAEKDYADGGYEDGFMCWAAVASNMLAWGGWGTGEVFGDEDAAFEHFQHHWVSTGGDPYWAIVWWFDGGMDNDPNHDVPGGGGFHKDLDPNDFTRGPFVGTNGVLDHIRSNTMDGYVSGLAITHPRINFSHAITCWGVNVDPETDEVIGLWITDSDDDAMGAPPRRNFLRYFGVAEYDGLARLDGYAGAEGENGYIIHEVLGLAANPNVPRDQMPPAVEVDIDAADADLPADTDPIPPTIEGEQTACATHAGSVTKPGPALAVRSTCTFGWPGVWMLAGVTLAALIVGMLLGLVIARPKA